MTEKKSNKDSSLKEYAKYSSLAFQMIIIIVGGTLIGIKLDQWLQWAFPLFKVVFPILSVFLALYVALKDIIKKK